MLLRKTVTNCYSQNVFQQLKKTVTLAGLRLQTYAYGLTLTGLRLRAYATGLSVVKED